MKFSKRVSDISVSSTIAVMQEAQSLRRAGIDVIDFGPGEPDFATPDVVKQAAVEAIGNNFTKYTAAGGTLELRRAVAEKFNRQSGSSGDFNESNVIITCGAKHAIYNLCAALFEEGDEVLLPAPYWVTFPEVIKMAEAVPIEVPTPAEGGFVLDPEVLAGKINPATRAVILNSPNNPTGAVIPEPTLETIGHLARQHNFFVMSDETYEHFIYGNGEFVSMAHFFNPKDRLFMVVGSLSKTYAMTGWRVGYCLAHSDLVKKLEEFQSHQTGNPTSISQAAALAALASDPALVEEMLRVYAERRKFVLEGVNQIAGMSCPPPGGAFYIFPDVRGALKMTGIHTSQEFARFLIREARVAVVPGSAFGQEGYIRISYATSMENLEEGLKRIGEAILKASEQPAH